MGISNLICQLVEPGDDLKGIFSWAELVLGVLVGLPVSQAAWKKTQDFNSAGQRFFAGCGWCIFSLAIVLGFFLGTYEFVDSGNHEPSDKSMSLNYKRHSQDFAAIAQMVGQDKALRSVQLCNVHILHPKDEGLSEIRANEYKLRLKRIDCDSLIVDKASGEINLEFWCDGQGGSADDADYESYNYCTKPRWPIVKSFDGMGDYGDVPYGYKLLDGNWYLHCSLNPSDDD